MSVDAAIEQGIAAFVASASEPSMVGDRPQLIKVHSDDSWVRVRRWPEETSRERAAFVADVRQALADAKIETAPKPIGDRGHGDLVVAIEGRLYEAQEWRDGRPNLRKPEPLDLRDRAVHAPAPLPAGGLDAAVAALAQHHLATAKLVTASAPAAPPRTILDAVARRHTDDHVLLKRQALEQTLLQRWIRACEQVFPAAETALSSVDFLTQSPPVVAYFDVWPAHLLFERSDGRERLSTVLDPGSAAVSTALVDVAQAITHGDGWTTAAAETALAAYGDVRRLTPDERRLLPTIAALDLVAETGRLFRIAFTGGRDIDWKLVDFARVGGAAALVSLETLLPSIRRATETGPLFKARPWVRRPRPDAAPRTSEKPRTPKRPR